MPPVNDVSAQSTNDPNQWRFPRIKKNFHMNFQIAFKTSSCFTSISCCSQIAELILNTRQIGKNPGPGCATNCKGTFIRADIFENITQTNWESHLEESKWAVKYFNLWKHYHFVTRKTDNKKANALSGCQ